MRSSQRIGILFLSLSSAHHTFLPVHEIRRRQNLYIWPVIGVVQNIRSHPAISSAAKAEQKLLRLGRPMPHLRIHGASVPRKIDVALRPPQLWLAFLGGASINSWHVGDQRIDLRIRHRLLWILSNELICLRLCKGLQVTREHDDLCFFRIVSQKMLLSAGTSMHRKNFRASQGALWGAARGSYVNPHPPILASSFEHPMNQLLATPE